MRYRPAFLLLAAMLLPHIALAADVRVSYVVDAKALKSAVAGTQLSFQIFSDSSCATPVATQVVNIETASLIEIIKPLKIKNGPKPPPTARINYVLTGVTPTAASYLTVTGMGVTPIGGTCQLQHASVGGTEPLPLPTCPVDAVRAGSLCVDRYESSLWDIPPAQTVLIQKVRAGTATLADLNGGGATQLGSTSAPFNHAAAPGTFPAYGVPLYQASITGVLPSTQITPIQAEAACEIVGKRLMTNLEWIAAAVSTPDTNIDNGSTDCNTNAPGVGVNAPVTTGSRSACVSAEGAFDMLGNVYEWTTGDFGLAWTHGGHWNDGTLAGPYYAGLDYPTGVYPIVGFRCAR